MGNIPVYVCCLMNGNLEYSREPVFSKGRVLDSLLVEGRVPRFRLYSINDPVLHTMKTFQGARTCVRHQYLENTSPTDFQQFYFMLTPTHRSARENTRASDSSSLGNGPRIVESLTHGSCYLLFGWG